MKKKSMAIAGLMLMLALLVMEAVPAPVQAGADWARFGEARPLRPGGLRPTTEAIPGWSESL